jgi:2-oxoglutarate-Fe(II)-dependent oxygenase superfamily protein
MSNIDDKLPLPDSAEVRLLCPDILVMRNIVPGWRDELIQISEKINRFQQSGQVRPNSDANYKDTNRTSHSFMVSSSDPDFGPCLRRFEEALLRAFHTGVTAYKAYNNFLNITHDSGFEMLRYHEGERFGIHTDAILGGGEGLRQLSALLYLNDDYEGGETYFPRQSLKFKAKAGDLLLFPSTFCYPHESLPVTKGTKYAIVTWFMAYPKIEEKTEDTHGEQGEGDAGELAPAVDGGVCLQQSAGSGSDAGEPKALDRECPAGVGGRAQ